MQNRANKEIAQTCEYKEIPGIKPDDLRLAYYKAGVSPPDLPIGIGDIAPCTFSNEEKRLMADNRQYPYQVIAFHRDF
jgi:hypothetical protein